MMAPNRGKPDSRASSLSPGGTNTQQGSEAGALTLDFQIDHIREFDPFDPQAEANWREEHSGDLDKFHNGSAGARETICKLLVNYFLLEKMKNWQLCLYHVEIIPQETRMPIRQQILKQHIHALGCRFLFDGWQLYTTKRLPNKVTELISQNVDPEGTYQVRLTFAKELLSLHAQFMQIFNLMKVILHSRGKFGLGFLWRNSYEPSTPITEDIYSKFNTSAASFKPLEDSKKDTATTSPLPNLQTQPELKLLDPEPENWVDTVEKEFVNQLQDKQRKRQEAIYELVKTEKYHCRMLNVLKGVFAETMVSELGLKESTVQSIFPRLNDLISIHFSFLWFMREEQRASMFVRNIGDLLHDQFSGYNSTCYMEVYAEIYSRHKEAVASYRALEKSDRRFQEFIQNQSDHPLMNKKGIPEATLFVTHRMTQYPLLIEKIIKYTDDAEELEKLRAAHAYVEEILVHINTKMADKENCKKLADICSKIDSKSFAVYRDQKFDKSDLLDNSRKLKFEGKALLTLASCPGKAVPVVVVILSDVVVFLQEVNQKYSFIPSDSSEDSVVPLLDLDVCEKPSPESSCLLLSRYNECLCELDCIYPRERRRWIESIRPNDKTPGGCIPDHRFSLWQRQELRNVQKQLSQERDRLKALQERQERRVAEEKDLLQREKEVLRLQEEDIQQQRDDLFRKSEALKKQGILLPTAALPPPMPVDGDGAASSVPHKSPKYAATLPRSKKSKTSTPNLKREPTMKTAMQSKQLLPMKLAKLGTG